MPTANTKPQEVASVEFVRGAFLELDNKLNMIYNKKGIEKSIKEMTNSMNKLQQQIEQAHLMMGIQPVNSRFQKFKNLFRGNK